MIQRVLTYNGKVLHLSDGDVATMNTSGVILYDIDNNMYTCIRIGDQEWIRQNLRTTHYADGTLIPYINGSTAWVNDTSGAYCEYDNSIGVYVNTYGYLYNQYAVDSSHGLVYFTRDGSYESGWRVPNSADISTFFAYGGGIEVLGGKLKEVGTTHWFTPNTSANDQYEFTALPAGLRTTIFDQLSYSGYFRTTSTIGGSAADFDLSYAAAYITWGPNFSWEGLSVRCVRNI